VLILAKRPEAVKCFLIGASRYGTTPNCRTTWLAPFANKQVTRSEEIAFFFIRPDVNLGQPCVVYSVPLDISITKVRN